MKLRSVGPRTLPFNFLKSFEFLSLVKVCSECLLLIAFVREERLWRG